MGDQDDAGRRKVDEQVERAKQGARKLAGWLGQRLEAATEQVKAHPTVREQVERLGRAADERAQQRVTGDLAGIYDEGLAGLLRAMDGLTAERAAREAAVEAVQQNVTALRLRGVKEPDGELAEYQAETKRLRTEIHELEAALVPFRDEAERLQRRRHAALGLLQAEPNRLEELRAAAAEHVQEAMGRLAELTDQTERAAQERPPTTES